MGLSASQARLLSITQRISNNELQSEIISNNKIMLSDANVAARDKYIAALDSKTFDYVSYNDTGIEETVAFTFNALNQYTPLKNQYSLYNTEGQILVSQTDADNYENSDSLFEFLSNYGIVDKEFVGLMKQYKTDKAVYDTENATYEKEFGKWKTDMDSYLTELGAYNAEKAEHERQEQERYDAELKEYEEAQKIPKLYAEFTEAVINNSHYNAAKNNDPGCFLHVLNNLLDYNGSVGGVNAPYTTSAKNPDGSAILLTSLWENNDYNMPNLQQVSTYMYNSEYIDRFLCDGKDVGTPEGKNLYQVDRAAGREPSIYTQLASDFIETKNGDGTYSYKEKTLRQKTIDMYYLIANSEEQRNTRSSGSGEFKLAQGNVTVSSFLTDYVEGDMQGLDVKEPDPMVPFPKTFDKVAPIFNLVKPTEPTPPQAKITDQPLAQWYINLWYAMEGAEKSDKISTVDNEQANFDHYIVDEQLKESTLDGKTNTQANKYYQVLDNKLASDTNWLQFALTNGIVTMKQAELQMTGDIVWRGVEFSSTSDIKERDDTSRIAKAEAEYKTSLSQIQAEDKQYDIALKKLDTEHSELLQEVESIKNVMGKNVERSFAAFS